ncbi:hypothetical protein SUGI_0681200 [Cryptomeria japonica]|nr:hypothetical protein SUGI_0681200 [Cryptomeria japonica]
MVGGLFTPDNLARRVSHYKANMALKMVIYQDKKDIVAMTVNTHKKELGAPLYEKIIEVFSSRDTFLIEEVTDFDASINSTSKATALQELGSGEADLAINHLNVVSNSSWRDMLMQGLERVKYFVNRMFSHDSNSNNVKSSPSVGNYYKILVRSVREIQGPEYTVAASIGTPPRKQLMGVDTLISISWSQCNPCKSKCDKRGICNYMETNGIAHGSEGDYITETLHVGGNKFKELHMGCTYRFVPPRQFAPSGHLELGRDPLSLVSHKVGGQFSYCLPNYLSVNATGSLRLGKGSIPSSVKVFTPMQKEPQFASSASWDWKEEGAVKENLLAGRTLRVLLQIGTTVSGTASANGSSSKIPLYRPSSVPLSFMGRAGSPMSSAP